MDKGKPILCLDFDGVIHSYTSGWKGADMITDPPVEGALEFIETAINQFDVQIFSSRSNQDGGIWAMQSWLIDHFEEYLDIDERFVRALVTEIIRWPKEKPPAMVTIDDRAITFTGEWPDMETLLAFKPWNKK